MDFLFANSGFAVQIDGTYLPRITRETCIHEKNERRKMYVFNAVKIADTQNHLSIEFKTIYCPSYVLRSIDNNKRWLKY